MVIILFNFISRTRRCLFNLKSSVVREFLYVTLSNHIPSFIKSG